MMSRQRKGKENEAVHGMFHLPVSGYLGGNFLVEGRSSGRAGIYSAKCTLF